MSTPAVAYLAQQYVEKRLTDGTTGFNGLIQQTALVYGVEPFTLSRDAQIPTLYLGRYTQADLIQSGNTGGMSFNLPMAIMSVAKVDSMGQLAMRVTPSTFSGQVVVSIDFYVTFPVTDSTPPDGNAMYHAILDALAGALNSAGSYNYVPQGLAYNNELMLEQGLMSWDGTRWTQFIPGVVMFNVVA